PVHARPLYSGVGLDPHVLAGLRRRRYVDALPVNRELQAVIGATDAVLLIATEVERRTAVRAEFIDQPDLAVAVAKGEQLLAEDVRAHRWTIGLGDLAREQDRHPVAAHHVAHRRPGPGAHERFGHLLVHRGATSLGLKPRWVAGRTGISLGDRARVFLIGDHEHDDLRALVRAWVAGDGVDRGRRLVERLARVQDPAGFSVDGELVGALDHVTEGMMARMPV